MIVLVICSSTFPILNLDAVSITSSCQFLTLETVNVFGISIVLMYFSLSLCLFVSLPRPYLSCAFSWKQSFLNRGAEDRSSLSPLMGS